MQMNGETNLTQLLRNMSPQLKSGEYIFCCVNDLSIIDPAAVIGTFREAEGITVILSRQTADELKLPYSLVCAWITLTVHSDLEAVGLTAAFSAALAEEDISCNVVAGFYHDHIFVKSKDADRAMTALQRLTLSV